MNATKTGCVKGTFFVFELDGNTLTVEHEKHADDHCAGQNEVRSAWFRAATELGLDLVGELNHGGGWIRGETKPEGVDQFGNVEAIGEALRNYRTTNRNPCGGCGYYDAGETNPYRVHFADGGSDENFATLEEAIQAAGDYADEMDADKSV